VSTHKNLSSPETRKKIEKEWKKVKNSIEEFEAFYFPWVIPK
jgi:hypothetical protein